VGDGEEEAARRGKGVGVGGIFAFFSDLKERALIIPQFF